MWKLIAGGRDSERKAGQPQSLYIVWQKPASYPINYPCRLASETVCLKLRSVSWLVMMSQVSTSCGDDLEKKWYTSTGTFLHQFCSENTFFLPSLAVRIELFQCASRFPVMHYSKQISVHLHLLTNDFVPPSSLFLSPSFFPFTFTTFSLIQSYSPLFFFPLYSEHVLIYSSVSQLQHVDHRSFTDVRKWYMRCWVTF